MTIFEAERILIKRRINEIIDNKNQANPPMKIVIACKTPVLHDDVPEFKALDEMLKILDNNLVQKGRNDYIKHRSNTKLPRLPKEMETIFENPVYQRENEKKLIEKAFNSIIVYSGSYSSYATYPTIDGKYAQTLEQRREYDALLKMKRIIDNNFKADDYYRYLDLREQTRLGTMSPDKYQVLMGKAPTKKREEKIVVEYGEPNVTIESSERTEEVQIGLIPATNNRALEISQEETQIGLMAPGTNQTLDAPQLASATTAPQDEPLLLEGTQATVNPNNDPKNPQDAITPDDELEEGLIEVEKITPWKKASKWWKNKSKGKKILIALGITAVVIAITVAIMYFLPTITAANTLSASAAQMSQVANLANQAVSNGHLWNIASTTEKFALHNANSGLMGMISNMSGLKTSYESVSGVWTIGSQTLADFASSSSIAATKAAAEAAAATSKAANFANFAKMASLSGIISMSTGVVMPTNKTEKYYSIKSQIEEFASSLDSIGNDARNKETEKLSGQIITSEGLAKKERKILLRKLQKAIENSRKRKNNVQLATIGQSIETNAIEHIEAELVDIQIPTIDKEKAIDVDYNEIMESSHSL